ncbi:hypothetical protein BBF96_12230 [Anoxybacter fermentans]|uniref:Peptidoglycan binding-like domain-containing protein n=1 Tax=Anoxybacter fermentans TaxID=1323375 RepID=A0A3Q9HS83_9FIRM|nr:RHS repeat-associated core domain-containing protein [Anoxybacter fermentans]AZR74096.1 hypothetical protein BBF96_12230 [Anoxybacter fermentans]
MYMMVIDFLAEYDQHGGGIQPLAEYFTGNGNIIARKMYGYHDRKLKGYQPNTRGFLFFYHHDVNRNVMDITDRSGNSLFKYRYDAFGEVYAGVMEPYNHHGLTEKFYDTKVKLYHFKARDYDPVIGQWIQRDRYRGRLSDPRTLHGYMYAYQNPVRFEDPLGYDIDVSVTDPIEPVVGIPEDPEAGIRDMLDDLGELINESGKIYGFGSQGEEVKEIQTILNEGFGKDVKVDGIYGQETKMAVEEVQAELGVTVVGIVGQETLEAMKKAVEEVDSMLNPELQIRGINNDIGFNTAAGIKDGLDIPVIKIDRQKQEENMQEFEKYFDIEYHYKTMDKYIEDPDSVSDQDLQMAISYVSIYGENTNIQKYKDEELNRFDREIVAWTNYFNDRWNEKSSYEIEPLDPSLVKALIARENRNFVPNLKEDGGPGRGLMQLEEGRSIDELRNLKILLVNVKDWSDVNQNIAGGIRWLYKKVEHVGWCKDVFRKKKKKSPGYKWYKRNEKKIKEGVKKYGTEWFGPVLAYNGTGERAWDYVERVFEAYKYGTDPQPPYEKNKLF